MPAENEEFPWLSYYKNYDYFEEIIKNHNKIKSIQNIGIGLYEITLSKGDKKITSFYLRLLFFWNG